MVRRSVAALAALCLLASPRIRAQDLDEAAIARALKAGTEGKSDSWTAECRAESSRADKHAATGPIRRTGSYDVVVSTTLGAIAIVAQQAKEAGKTLSVSDVPSWISTTAVHVFVEPRKPPYDWSSRSLPIVEVPSSIELIVINSKAHPASVPPEAKDFATADASFSESKWLVSQLPQQPGADGRPTPKVYKNSRARATFSLESIKALPAGDLDVVIVTKDAERRCSIRASDRTRLFG